MLHAVVNVCIIDIYPRHVIFLEQKTRKTRNPTMGNIYVNVVILTLVVVHYGIIKNGVLIIILLHLKRSIEFSQFHTPLYLNLTIPTWLILFKPW